MIPLGQWSSHFTDQGLGHTGGGVFAVGDNGAILYFTRATATGLSNDPTPRLSKTWNWAVSGPYPAFTCRYVIDQNSTWPSPSGSYSDVNTASVAGNEGTWYLHVQAMDAQGIEGGVVTVSTVLDSTVVSVVLSSSAPDPTSSTPIPITVTFSEPVTGFGTSGITVGNGTLSGFSGSGSTYTFNVTPTADGLVTVDDRHGWPECGRRLEYSGPAAKHHIR